MTGAAAAATRRALAAGGIDAVYGSSLEAVDVVPVGDPELAALLAAAHERVYGRRALAVDGGAVRIDHEGACDRRIDADPDVVARIAAAANPVMLAGPGVARDGAVAGLHALATAGSLGVLNTWGAKGVFDWRSPHHLATVGLQALDFELGGCAGADLIVATGLDAGEAPPSRWQLAPHVTVPPRALHSTAERVTRARARPATPPLRAALTAVTHEGWAATGTPMAPTQATLAYSTAIGSLHGLVAADPGWAGYWVARTFPTSELGSVVVPAEESAAGFAAACALVARLRQPLRPLLAAVDCVDERTAAVLELARSLGIGFGVEVWADDGAPLDRDAHDERLRRISVATTPTVVTLATDPRQRARMIEAAGPVIAWAGLPG